MPASPKEGQFPVLIHSPCQVFQLGRARRRDHIVLQIDLKVRTDNQIPDFRPGVPVELGIQLVAPHGHKQCVTIAFAHILGHESTFLIQNMCPVSESKPLKRIWIVITFLSG